MLLSVANSRPRNIESVQTESLYPDSLKESASNLINFIERYYEHLNRTGLPSSEIASITREKDIDIVSDKYLTQIQSLIARNIPNSRVLDKVTLYRIIIQYYHTRGSEDSIHTFFKIFFDEIVSIFYPKNYLFDLSGGSGRWHPIDIDSLRTSRTNPNKNTLSVTSDYKIGPFPTSTLGPYTVTLKCFSPGLWTYGGVAQSFNLPYIQKVNVAAEGETPVYRWVYRYKDDVELYSTNDTTWPDEATWEVFSRNIEYVNFISSTNLLESGEYNLYEDGLPVLFEDAENDGTIEAQNIEYGVLTITPIVPSTDTEEILDESGKILIDESIDRKEITTEQIINVGDETIDLSVFGLETEGEDYILSERGLPPEDNGIVVEGAGGANYTIAAQNVEYSHIFTVTAIPEYSTKIGDLIHSLEAEPVETIYRCEDLSPIIWKTIPRDELVWTYSDNKSFASDLYKIHDGYYWQKYSYVIKSQLPYEEWGDDYLKFVHPSGLKLFSAILHEFIARTEWNDVIDYVVRQPQENYAWINAYRPPALGYHTPSYQPGWLTANERLLTIILTRLLDRNAPEPLIRMVQLILRLLSTNDNYRDKTVYEDYQRWAKFVDPNELVSGFAHKTIAQASAPYSPSASRLFSNISSFITYDILDFSYYPWFYSELIPLDPTYEDTDPDYNEATITAFDIPMENYMNSTLESKEPLIYRYEFDTQDSETFLTEDSNNKFITEGQTNVQTATVVSNKSSVFEGESVRFYTSTKFIAHGTTLYYTVSSPDVVPISGSFTIKNNAGFFRVVPNINTTPESSRTFTVSIRKGAVDGPILVTSAPITVNDNPNLAEYVINSNKVTIVEGETVIFTVSTANVPNGTTVYYTATNISDVSPNYGSVQINNGGATITIKATVDDLNSESNESFALQLRSTGIDGPILATSPYVTVQNSYWVWQFDDISSTLTGLTITTSPASQIKIAWDDGTPTTTIQSGEVTSHVYTTSPTLFNAEPFTDSDGDGYSNLVETVEGTNQNDPAAFPISTFNVFNDT